jgi:hypothetical protein
MRPSPVVPTADRRVPVYHVWMADVLDAVSDLGADVYAVLDARVADLTGQSMHELPVDELRACLESMRADLVAALSSSDDLVAGRV